MGALALAVLASLASTRVLAQQDPDPDQVYRDLIHLALEEFRLRNWPEARVLFRQAHGLRPSARTLRGLGVVSYEMRDYTACIRELRAALQSDVRPLTPDQRAEAQRLLQRALGFVGRFTLRLTPAEAEVRIDSGEPQHEPDGSILLSLGPHWVQVQAEGYQPIRREVEVEGGERGTLFFDLEPETRPRAAAGDTQPAAGSVAVAASEEAAPLSEPAPAAREPRSDRLERAGWASLGSTVALGGATLAIWLTGQRKLDKRVDDCEATAATCSGRTDDLRLHSTFTNVGLALTASAAAVGVISLGLSRKRERPVEVSFTPGGVSLRGGF